MAKRTFRPAKKSEYSSWNFVLFLTLAFILMVILMGLIGRTTSDLQARAGLKCPSITLPDAKACPGGWRFVQNTLNGCPTFVCDAK